MSQRPISRYPVPTVESLPEDLRARILEVQEKAGFVPNVFLALAHRPDEARAFFAYHDALMLRPPSGPSGLSKGEKEMIVVATSGANGCRPSGSLPCSIAISPPWFRSSSNTRGLSTSSSAMRSSCCSGLRSGRRTTPSVRSPAQWRCNSPWLQ